MPHFVRFGLIETKFVYGDLEYTTQALTKLYLQFPLFSPFKVDILSVLKEGWKKSNFEKKTDLQKPRLWGQGREGRDATFKVIRYS